ncbi:putative glycosyl transferase [Coleophoma cylindrospora]|uniref:Putative glycosyl transferase n=1 Tax=Coleophoma cylindrospora TaxID=1849047 RepID=A0A3D8SR53_9HELO|nr:putative glycosyl transferase [Coleophoma cylindrospora]
MPLGGRLTRQIQRALPVYAAIIFVVSFLSFHESVSSSLKSADLWKRDFHSKPSSKALGDLFPKKIWQTWKVDPLAFEERDLMSAKTWTAKNPGYRYEVLTDSNDLHYVETHFGPNALNRPDIVYIYRTLTARIIKADILRYLVMYIEGGLYVDIDVEALKPVERFIPDRYVEKDIDMVIGVEIDQPHFANHTILGPKSQSFCQWTFMCKPRLPVMLKLVDNIIKWLNEVAQKQNVPISEITLDFDEVIVGTGPSAFTNAVLAELSTRHGQKVTWDTFHNMAESKLVGGVLVLTVEAFAAGQGHSDSGNHNARTALVKHHYHASNWPNRHPRYNHPVYGEVEKCNWDVECVALWDISKWEFENLPEEEQAKMIAEKQAAIAAEEAQANQDQAPMQIPPS